MTRTISLVTWLLVAAALSAVAPRASAHGDSGHDSAPAPDRAAVAALAVTDALSSLCPGPGAPVHACACRNLSLCERTEKLAVFDAPAGRLLVLPAFRKEEPGSEGTVPGKNVLARSSHRPRAPPSVA